MFNWMYLKNTNYEQNDNNNTTKCSQGNGGAAAVVCSEVGLNVPKGNFIIHYLPHHGVLDEGEGLEDEGHVGVEDPVIVSVDLGHGLKICLIFFI